MKVTETQVKLTSGKDRQLSLTQIQEAAVGLAITAILASNFRLSVIQRPHEAQRDQKGETV